MHRNASRAARRWIHASPTEEHTMRLFKRKQEDEALRCAGCGEIAPAGALECSMCGEELVPERSDALHTPEGKAHEVGRHWA